MMFSCNDFDETWEDSDMDMSKLVEMHPINVEQVRDQNSVSWMLDMMMDGCFSSRALGESVIVLEEMIRDPKCKVVLTLSGAMTMAGLTPLIVTAIERGWVHCIIATGALIGHGMVEGLGMKHYKASPSSDDEENYRKGLNRVYDTYEPEQNLDEMEGIVRQALQAFAQGIHGLPGVAGAAGSARLLNAFGELLPGQGVLQTARKHGVLVIIPALTDSELGLDIACYNEVAEESRDGSMPPLCYDALQDLVIYRSFCLDVVQNRGKLGIWTIGGGVPRNWAQQIGPFVDVGNKRIGRKDPQVRFSYGVRICPDPAHYGHLSGCTYSEGVSWGKFVPVSQGGKYAEVLLDATVAWPLICRALIERDVRAETKP